jgi:hypothetical protein
MPTLAADVPPPTIVICREHKPEGSHEWWSWRQIDGRA